MCEDTSPELSFESSKSGQFSLTCITTYCINLERSVMTIYYYACYGPGRWWQNDSVKHYLTDFLVQCNTNRDSVSFSPISFNLWRRKWPTTQLFNQQPVQAYTIENIKVSQTSCSWNAVGNAIFHTHFSNKVLLFFIPFLSHALALKLWRRYQPCRGYNGITISNQVFWHRYNRNRRSHVESITNSHNQSKTK